VNPCPALAGHPKRHLLTPSTRPAQNRGSLRNVSSTPAPMLKSRIFCAPHSARRASARLARSMGVSGIRKDPDALTCVESTPTPFRVVLNLRNVRRPAMAASNPLGAHPRQSRTLQNLDRFNPVGVSALAVVGLVLSDAVNQAYLVVNDELSPDLADSTGTTLDALYLLQDALHGDSDKIPAALASFLDAAESGVCRG